MNSKKIKAPKTTYVCVECGVVSPKWMGRCPSCDAWDSLQENVESPTAPTAARSASTTKAVRLNDVDTREEPRLSTQIGELDRVLGGGIVRGSLILVSGDPGIGKSTLLLQMCKTMPGQTILYVSGEESAQQIKLRAQRIGMAGDGCLLLADTDIINVLSHIEEHKPNVVIIDSIQTMANPDSSSMAGNVSQVRECTMLLTHCAKRLGIPMFIVSHVTKEGGIAGPKVLEHVVDCVLYFEGERHNLHRVLRAVKNRFGSTNEIGVFEMKGDGLAEVANPSELLLQGRPADAPGSCVVSVLEGTRPILAEVQALCTPTAFPSPRRSANGIDYNRIILLMAVLEKRMMYPLSGYDAYVNVIGGLSIDEPAVDLGAVIALASSYKNLPIPQHLAAIGEVGLTGEVRNVNAIDVRVNEAARLGFKSIMLPKGSVVKPPEGVSLLYVDTVGRCIDLLFGR